MNGPHPMRRRRFPLRAAALCCGMALLLGAAAPARAADGRAAPEVPPATEPPARPAPTPEPLTSSRVDLHRGFQFGWGFHTPTVEAPELDSTFEPGSLPNDGVSITMDLLLGAFRLGYVRQIYRHQTDDTVTLDGKTVGLAGFESDQLWAFHGVRPWKPLYLGYGLGWQRRKVSVLDPSRRSLASFHESLAMAAVMLDWAFVPPFSFQVRHVREQGGRFFRLIGETYLLAYIVPF